MKKNDPVCGMTVDTESAGARSVHSGTVYVFCSPACQRAFDEHPEQFLSERPARVVGPDRTDPPFTRADGIVAPMFGAAGSGGLEYEPLL